MRKITTAVLMIFSMVALFATPAQAASYKLKLTVIQTDGVVRLYDDGDQSQKGGDKQCSNKSHLLWNPEPWSVSTILLDKLVTKDTKIKVLGASGQTVGVGKITAAKFVKKSRYLEDPEIGFVVEGYCKFSSTITVKGSDFYEIKVGKLDSIDASMSELKKKKWSYTVKVSN